MDGSKLAECALSCAEEIAKGSSAEVILISVTERVQGFRTLRDPSQPGELEFVPEGAGKQEEQAQEYLSRIAKGLEEKGLKVQTEVLIGNPAEEIVIYSKAPGCDLIVMASHGRTGPSLWTFGSVANKVLKASPVPVLMVKAPGCVPRSLK